MAVTFDPNMWYQISVGGTSQAMVCTPLYANSGTKGATFFTTTNTTDPVQRWQVSRFNDTHWTFRCALTGPNVWMAVNLDLEEQTDGQTRPIVARGDVVDRSAFWSIASWNDNTYYLANAANGSAWHLNRNSKGTLAMSNNISAPQNGQRFEFDNITAINDQRFSTVSLLGLTASTSTAQSGSSAPTQSTGSLSPSSSSSSSPGTQNNNNSPTSSTSSGLSTGAKIGIGASIGGVALLALILLGLLVLRRKRQRKMTATTMPELPPETSTEGSLYKYHYHNASGNEDGVVHELPQRGVVEVPANEAPVELMGSDVRK